MSSPSRPDPLRAGLVVLALGWAPLLCIIAAESLGLVHDANPIGFGLLSFVATPAGLGLIAIGAAQRIARRSSAQSTTSRR